MILSVSDKSRDNTVVDKHSIHSQWTRQVQHALTGIQAFTVDLDDDILLVTD